MRFGLVPATDKILRGMNEPFLDNSQTKLGARTPSLVSTSYSSVVLAELNLIENGAGDTKAKPVAIGSNMTGNYHRLQDSSYVRSPTC
jgi:hypothetical protein